MAGAHRPRNCPLAEHYGNSAPMGPLSRRREQKPTGNRAPVARSRDRPPSASSASWWTCRRAIPVPGGGKRRNPGVDPGPRCPPLARGGRPDEAARPSGRSAGSSGGRTRTCAFEAGVLRGVRDHVHTEPPLAAMLFESVPGRDVPSSGRGTANRATRAALAGRSRETGMIDHPRVTPSCVLVHKPLFRVPPEVRRAR